MAMMPTEWVERVVAILDAGMAGIRAITSTARLDCMMKRIMTKDPVVIPDGHGGILDTIYVEVPAMQNETTGEVFLGDDALGMFAITPQWRKPILNRELLGRGSEE